MIRYIRKNWLLVTIWSVLTLIFAASILIICLDKVKNIVPPEKEVKKSAVDQESYLKDGEDGQHFPNQLLAPFVDLASWVDMSNKYSVNGVPNLSLIKQESGLKYYNLGFVRPDDNNPLASDGSIRWGWGGFYKLSEKGNDGFQYEGIKKTINDLRKNGGDVIVSVGGQLGRAPWLVTNNVNKLRDMYLEIIDAYDLKRIDLDIEEGNQAADVNLINAKAIKKVQDRTDVEVVLTIPIMPYGWTKTQIALIKAYLNAGVNIKLINSMTMCYGSEVNPGEDFGSASIRALRNANRQLIEIYKEYGVNLTEKQAYAMMGATVDIGYENAYNPVFTTSMTKAVADFANLVDLGMYSYWSLNRDTKMQPNSGVKNQYEFYQASAVYPN